MSDQTERDTPRMAERTDRQAQIDPWAVTHASHCETYFTRGAEDCDCWVRRLQPIRDAVDAARAADAAQIATLITERDLLKRGVATVTWGDADAVIAKLVAERDTALQENARMDAAAEDSAKDLWLLQGEAQTLREALGRLRDCDWTIGRGDRMDAVRDIARDALALRPQKLQP